MIAAMKRRRPGHAAHAVGVLVELGAIERDRGWPIRCLSRSTSPVTVSAFRAGAGAQRRPEALASRASATACGQGVAALASAQRHSPVNRRLTPTQTSYVPLSVVTEPLAAPSAATVSETVSASSSRCPTQKDCTLHALTLYCNHDCPDDSGRPG